MRHSNKTKGTTAYLTLPKLSKLPHKTPSSSVIQATYNGRGFCRMCVVVVVVVVVFI